MLNSLPSRKKERLASFPSGIPLACKLYRRYKIYNLVGRTAVGSGEVHTIPRHSPVVKLQIVHPKIRSVFNGLPVIRHASESFRSRSVYTPSSLPNQLDFLPHLSYSTHSLPGSTRIPLLSKSGFMQETTIPSQSHFLDSLLTRFSPSLTLPKPLIYLGFLPPGEKVSVVSTYFPIKEERHSI